MTSSCRACAALSTSSGALPSATSASSKVTGVSPRRRRASATAGVSVPCNSQRIAASYKRAARPANARRGHPRYNARPNGGKTVTMVETAKWVAEAAIRMTDEQKFVFDLKGWLLLPALVERDRIDAIREHVTTLVLRPNDLPSNQRSSYSGPCEVLLDHPAIAAILREVLQMPDPTLDCYGFRCENSFPMYRPTGGDGLDAHGGGPNMNPLFSYRAQSGKIYAGVTRVIWEMNDVAKTDGGTLIMSGSHKSSFPVPRT